MPTTLSSAFGVARRRQRQHARIVDPHDRDAALRAGRRVGVGEVDRVAGEQRCRCRRRSRPARRTSPRVPAVVRSDSARAIAAAIWSSCACASTSTWSRISSRAAILPEPNALPAIRSTLAPVPVSSRIVPAVRLVGSAFQCDVARQRALGVEGQRRGAVADQLRAGAGEDLDLVVVGRDHLDVHQLRELVDVEVALVAQRRRGRVLRRCSGRAAG